MHVTKNRVSGCIYTYLEHFYTEKTLISCQGTNPDKESEIKNRSKLVCNFRLFSFFYLCALIKTNNYMLNNKNQITRNLLILPFNVSTIYHLYKEIQGNKYTRYVLTCNHFICMYILKLFTTA